MIHYAEALGRTPSSLAMKCCNIASLDPAFLATGRQGLSGASLADRAMWDEMTHDWEAFLLASEEAFLLFGCPLLEEASTEPSVLENVPEEVEESEEPQQDYTGRTRTVTTQARVGQRFFRRAVLNAYENRCCITGLQIPRLLIASHIVPWKENRENRLNPQNGLALSTLHDAAFDKGMLTINADYTVRISTDIGQPDDQFFQESLQQFNGREIRLPNDRFLPDPIFLEYHRDVIFEKWRTLSSHSSNTSFSF
jgi:hypothetical protein